MTIEVLTIICSCLVSAVIGYKLVTVRHNKRAASVAPHVTCVERYVHIPVLVFVRLEPFGLTVWSQENVQMPPVAEVMQAYIRLCTTRPNNVDQSMWLKQFAEELQACLHKAPLHADER